MQRNNFIILILILLLFSGGCGQQTTEGDAHSEDAQILCTADVQECPDGSFVARDVNNNCAFQECP